MATRRALVAQVRRQVARVKQTRPARAVGRFSAAGGGVLSGGIAYASLFSLFAGLALGFTVLLAVLGSDEALRDKVVDAVADVLPGLVDTGDGNGGAVPLEALELSPAFTVAGVVAALALVMSALSAVGALQTGLRAMLDLRVVENVVVGTLRRLGGLVAAGVAVVVSAVLSSAVAGLLGGAAQGLVSVAGVVVAFVVDTATFLFAVRVLAGARPARRDLLWGAVIAAVGLGAIRLVGATLVAGAASNPLLASFAAVVVLLAWVNLVARVLLLAAAWTADPPPVDEHRVDKHRADEHRADEHRVDEPAHNCPADDRPADRTG